MKEGDTAFSKYLFLDRKKPSWIAKETYKKARSSKDDKEHSHPTEHDESDDLEMLKAIKEKE